MNNNGVSLMSYKDLIAKTNKSDDAAPPDLSDFQYTLETLPTDVLRHIFARLNEQDRVMLQRTSKNLYFSSKLVSFLFPHKTVIWEETSVSNQFRTDNWKNITEHLVSIPKSKLLASYKNEKISIISSDDMQIIKTSPKIPDQQLSLFAMNTFLLGSIHEGKIILWSVKTLDVVTEIEFEQFEGYIANNSRYIFTVSENNIHYYDTHQIEQELPIRNNLIELSLPFSCYSADAVGESYLRVTQNCLNDSAPPSVKYLLYSLNDMKNCTVVTELPYDFSKAPVTYNPFTNTLFSVFDNNVHRLNEEGIFKALCYLDFPNFEASVRFSYQLYTLDKEHLLIGYSKIPNSATDNNTTTYIKIFSLKENKVIKSLEKHVGYLDIRLSLFGKVITFSSRQDTCIVKSHRFSTFTANVCLPKDNDLDTAQYYF